MFKYIQVNSLLFFTIKRQKGGEVKIDNKQEKVFDMSELKELERKDNLKQIISLIKKDPDLEGSFFQDLFEIMSSDKRPEIKKEVNGDKEKSIGEMNNLNNSSIALIEHYADIERELSNEISDAKKQGEKISLERVKEIKIELNKTRGRFELSRKLNYEILRERFEDPDELKETRFEMRLKDKVVSKPGHHFLPEDLPTFLRRAIGISLIKI
jgi:hypothetical protein